MLCIGDRPWVGRSVMGSRDPKGCGGMPIKRRRAAARRPAGDGIRQNTQGLTDSQPLSLFRHFIFFSELPLCPIP
jgi:hypothetical protein